MMCQLIYCYGPIFYALFWRDRKYDAPLTFQNTKGDHIYDEIDVNLCSCVTLLVVFVFCDLNPSHVTTNMLTVSLA
jgi:hypothetical protein